MKKILFIVAILAVGFSAQAAAISWKFNTNANTWNGYTVYAVSSVASSYESVDAVKSSLLSSGSYATITGTRSYVASGSAENSSWTDGQSISYYYVIVDKDEKNFWTSGAQTANAATTGTPTASVFSAADGAALLSTAGTAFAGGPVPEPTSGLLMLIGVAGLALRRRRV